MRVVGFSHCDLMESTRKEDEALSYSEPPVERLTFTELTAAFVADSASGAAIDGPLDGGYWPVPELSDVEVADLVSAIHDVQLGRAA